MNTMASDIEKMTVGDSARNISTCDLKQKKSNHVFDGAGEHVRYHSDSESLGSRKSKTRFINPAIYVETVESTHSVTSLHTDSSSIEDVTPHPHTSYRSNSTPMLSGRPSTASSGSVKRISCRLSGTVTYNNDDPDEDTPRNHLTYRDGSDTFRLSVASVSTTTTAQEERARNDRKKQEAFKKWLQRKELERREKLRCEEKVKRQSVSVPTPEQREETFRRWLERKRDQNERRKAEDIMRRYRETERLEQDRLKRIRDKEEKLADWIRKKEEDMKAMKTREERRTARAAIEEERRRVNGERAYRDWLRSSKNKPLPVPLNQGELSMRGSVSEMYVNPVPWQT